MLSSVPFHPKKLYRAATSVLKPETVRLNNSNDIILYNIGIQEYTFSVPIQSGPSIFDLASDYSMLLSGELLNIKEPSISFEFPDAKSEWETIRIVMKSNVEVRVFLQLVQVVEENATLEFPNASEMIKGTYVRLPKQSGKKVAHRHYVVDIRKQQTPTEVIAGAIERLPDTSTFDIFYLARYGSYRVSNVRRVQSTTVSQPPQTKAGYPLVTRVTVSSFRYNIWFSDRKGTVYYVVTEENKLCDENMLNANIPGKDFKDKLIFCGENSPGVFQFGEFTVSKRESPLDGDENRGEFSGYIDIKGLPPYKSYVVYSTGISFGRTAQFGYKKTLINLVGFAISSGTSIIYEGNLTKSSYLRKTIKTTTQRRNCSILLYS